MCRTCSFQSYDPNNMGCLTCYEEYGDSMVGTSNCVEKYCENLFYRDKDTGMKTCVNGTSCPHDYPIKEYINECIRNQTEDKPTTKPTEEDYNTNRPSESSSTNEPF